jgi:hypothetical protein
MSAIPATVGGVPCALTVSHDAVRAFVAVRGEGIGFELVLEQADLEQLRSRLTVARASKEQTGVSTASLQTRPVKGGGM